MCRKRPICSGRLLGSYTHRFEKDPNFISLAFSQKMRHAAAPEAAYAAKQAARGKVVFDERRKRKLEEGGRGPMLPRPPRGRSLETHPAFYAAARR